MSILDTLIGIIAPNTCLVCADEAGVLCDACRTENVIAPPSRCFHCLKITTSYALCDNAKRSFRLQHMWVAGIYGGVAKSLVQELKITGVREAAKAMAFSMHDILPYLPEQTIVVPVPTTTKHVRRRGFDHTRLIARELSKVASLSYDPLLSRLDQHTQVGSSKKQRISQLEGHMFVRKDEYVTGKDILLVDDVLTTGATFKEAARALKQAGARKVDAVVFAQKVL